MTTKTDHSVLGGRLILSQPAAGYRAAIDPVLLAASVAAHSGEKVLDLGTGIGTAALCLVSRCPGTEVTGLELQEELVHLALRNTDQNGLASVQMLAGDICKPPSQLREASFDHVMANPPYYRADQAQLSPNQIKAVANVEGAEGLGGWVRAAKRFLKEGGLATFIHTGERLSDLIEVFGENQLGSIEIMPLWPHIGEPAKRVIVRCRKGGKAGTILHAGLVLHADDGGYTPEADAILKLAGPLEF
jgi:tRNA1(Val) A37 N6-methylase TrmN6